MRRLEWKPSIQAWSISVLVLVVTQSGCDRFGNRVNLKDTLPGKWAGQGKGLILTLTFANDATFTLAWSAKNENESQGQLNGAWKLDGKLVELDFAVPAKTDIAKHLPQPGTYQATIEKIVHKGLDKDKIDKWKGGTEIRLTLVDEAGDSWKFSRD